MNTLLLDQVLWDLVSDAAGNIAQASQPYAQAQDVASACRLFKGECYYDTTKGVPYFDTTLGKQPPLQIVRAQLETAALTVPEVVAAKAVITSLAGRKVSGQIQFTDITGAANAVKL